MCGGQEISNATVCIFGFDKILWISISKKIETRKNEKTSNVSDFGCFGGQFVRKRNDQNKEIPNKEKNKITNSDLLNLQKAKRKSKTVVQVKPMCRYYHAYDQLKKNLKAKTTPNKASITTK